jgi:hypothetical protein
MAAHRGRDRAQDDVHFQAGVTTPCTTDLRALSGNDFRCESAGGHGGADGRLPAPRAPYTKVDIEVSDDGVRDWPISLI